MFRCRAFRAYLRATAIAPCVAMAVAQSVAEPVDFSETVQPLLETKCLACHPEAGGQAGLSLASRDAILRGGTSGPAVVPGNPQASLLISKVSGEEPAMPLAGDPLEESQIDLLRRWIAEGARAGAPARTAAGAR